MHHIELESLVSCRAICKYKSLNTKLKETLVSQEIVIILATRAVQGPACSTILSDCHRKSNIVSIENKRPKCVIIVFAHEFALKYGQITELAQVILLLYKCVKFHLPSISSCGDMSLHAQL